MYPRRSSTATAAGWRRLAAFDLAVEVSDGDLAAEVSDCELAAEVSYRVLADGARNTAAAVFS
jgi:hypothetical protein